MVEVLGKRKMKKIYKRIIGSFLVSICIWSVMIIYSMNETSISLWDAFIGTGIILTWVGIFILGICLMTAGD